jgi:hypothetical protein
VAITSRGGFYAGVAVALFAGLFLARLWTPARQIRRHSDNLLRALEKRDWARFGSFLSDDYQDQWGNDHSAVLERTHEVFRYVRTIRLAAANPTISVMNHHGYWTAKITIDGDNGEATTMIKERVNSLTTPFQLEWQRKSGKPWDWKLVRVTNPELQIPEFQ